MVCTWSCNEWVVRVQIGGCQGQKSQDNEAVANNNNDVAKDHNAYGQQPRCRGQRPQYIGGKNLQPLLYYNLLLCTRTHLRKDGNEILFD